jgi:predicted phage terminase large subunit-like protein
VSPSEPDVTELDPAELEAFRKKILSRLRLRLVPDEVKLTPAQILFVLQMRREGFYGGAAGGGKTYALLSAALQFVDVPGYSAILFRRTHKELERPGQLMALAHEWLDPLGNDVARWSETKKRWTFASHSTLHFGYMDVEADASSHRKGPGYQFIGFDELTEFPEEWYTSMFSRLRRPAGGTPKRNSAGESLDMVPLRMRGASNPGGQGHAWVKNRFVDDETRNPATFFIPATISDNPRIDQESYVQGLQELHPLERARMLNGDWTATEVGQSFPRGSWLIVDRPPCDVIASVRWWDLAATEKKKGKKEPDYTVGWRFDRLADGRALVADIRRFRKGPNEVEQAIMQTIVEDGPHVPVWLELEGGAGARLALDQIKRRVGGLARVMGEPASNTGAKTERGRSLSIAVANGTILVLRRHWTSGMLDEAESWPHGLNDDQIDAGSGAYSKLPQVGYMRSPAILAASLERARAEVAAQVAGLNDAGQGDVPAMGLVW